MVLESHRRNLASRRPAPVKPNRDLSDLRDYHVAGKITLDQLEAQVGDVLEDELRAGTTGAGPTAAEYTDHWVVHVYDAPLEHHLHIHLS